MRVENWTTIITLPFIDSLNLISNGLIRATVTQISTLRATVIMQNPQISALGHKFVVTAGFGLQKKILLEEVELP